MKKNNHKEIFLWGSCKSFVRSIVSWCFALALLTSPAFAQEQKNISIKADNVPISSVIKQIEQQSGFTFFYNNDVNVNSNVTVSLQNADLKTALNQLFKGKNVTWSIEDKHVILSKTQVVAKTPTNNKLEGTVLDRTGSPITGAAVVVSETLRSMRLPI